MVRASLNVSARVDKSCIYFCEVYIVYSVYGICTPMHLYDECICTPMHLYEKTLVIYSLYTSFS